MRTCGYYAASSTVTFFLSARQEHYIMSKYVHIFSISVGNPISHDLDNVIVIKKVVQQRLYDYNKKDKLLRIQPDLDLNP